MKNGYSVILEAENSTIYKQKNVDGSWEKKPFEIAAAETATPNNIRNALKHCAKKPNCEVAVVFIPIKLDDYDGVMSGIKKYFGLAGTKQFKKFERIYIITVEDIIYSQ